MSTEDHISPDALIAQIKIWEKEHVKALQKSAEYKEHGKTFEGLIVQGTKMLELFQKSLPQDSQATDSVSPAPKAEASPLQADVEIKYRAAHGSWTSEILKIAEEFPDGISYPDVKKLLPENLAQRLKSSEKGFHSALLKLHSRGLIVRHNEHVFTKENHVRFMREVESGAKQDVVSKRQNPSQGAPLMNAILSILNAADRPLKGIEVVNQVIELPAVGEAAERNNTGVYNVLSRLVKQGKIAKDETEKTYFIPSGEEEGTGSDKDKSASESVNGGEQRSLLNGGGTLGFHLTHS